MHALTSSGRQKSVTSESATRLLFFRLVMDETEMCRPLTLHELRVKPSPLNTAAIVSRAVA
jgi:hypothetical protein